MVDRRLTAAATAVLAAAGLAACGAGGGATTGAAPNPVNTAAMTCADLAANGGVLLQTFSTELAAEVAKGSGRSAAASDLQTILIAGCRQQTGGFHPAKAAIEQYHEEHG